MQEQEDLLNKLSSKREELSAGGEFTEEEWIEIRGEIGRATKGFLSNDTVELINLLDEHGLYIYPRYLLKLEQKLRKDFNELRKVYVGKGWVYLPQIGQPPSTLEYPVDWEKYSRFGRR